jgi:hypothetical protein
VKEPSPATNEPADQAPRRSRSGLAFWLAAGVCAVTMGLAGHAVVQRVGRPAPAPPALGEAPRAAPMPPTGSSPADWARDPLAGLGLERLEQPPEAAIAPEGAVLTYAFRRSVPGGSAEIVNYSVRASLKEVEAFYAEKLPAMGLRPLPVARPLPGRRGRTLLFAAPDSLAQYDVTLTPAGDGERVKVGIVIVRPDASAAGPADRR